MRIYARLQGNLVVEIIDPLTDAEGQEVPIDERYTQELVSTLIDVTDVEPKPEQGWTFDGSTFAAPVPYQPGPAEILASNSTVRDALLAQAAIAIAPLQDAVDLDEATDAEAALLKQWKQYRVAVNRVDLTQASPVWPTVPGT
ncbi:MULTISPECIES: tail fiber assembly protein [unclassified Caballeronia]|uniref:tail fiber assembly protein n=1 Tax=unclassified Caballeronia TaxID=2646786 RepID=UPI002027E924|nr:MULTISPECIES: tail fiber assembly protein [unclassified Caballeronia]